MHDAGYKIRWAGGFPVIKAPIEVDASNAAELRQTLLSGANGSHPTLIVDMSETVFCDSTGLHQLIRAHKRAIAAGGEVRLVIRATPVLRLFTIMGIDGMFAVFPTLADAVAGPRAAPGPPMRVRGAEPQPFAAEQTQAEPAPG
jgi:anti-sigma B factor antagonist